MKVSVIVPIFNTGSYLTTCIDSISRQSYHNLEIILIDDGSNQVTRDICDEIANSDNRIILIHKKNEGVSIARNKGLDVATGEVICFVDSDDTIEPDMISSLVEALIENDAQIAMCDATTIWSNGKTENDTIPDYTRSSVINVKDITPATLTRLAGSAWRCAYRRTDISSDTPLKFPEGIKFSEDRIFNLLAISKAKRIAYIRRPLYNRLIRSGSACFRYYPDMCEQIVAMRKCLIDTVKLNWGTKYIESYEKQISGQIRYAITNYTSPDNGLTYRESILKLKQMCDNSEIRECLIASNSNDTRSRMILKNQYRRVFLIGRIINNYHKLCQKGQYQA